MAEFVKGEVVVIPFPFSDLSGSKKRPALVLADLEGDDILLCQITSQQIFTRKKTMKEKNAIQLFEDKKVRCIWDADEEKWFFSIIDVIEVLTGSDRPRKYWNDLKNRLTREGSELSEKIGQLKMKSADGKSYKTDVADTGQLFRLKSGEVPTSFAPYPGLWPQN